MTESAPGLTGREHRELRIKCLELAIQDKAFKTVPYASMLEEYILNGISTDTEEK